MLVSSFGGGIRYRENFLNEVFGNDSGNDSGIQKKIGHEKIWRAVNISTIKDISIVLMIPKRETKE